MRHPNGFTLVEMMASITVSSVLMVLSMGMVHRVLNLESSSRDQGRVSRSLTRLSHDFRNDIHQAVDIERDQETGLRLRMIDDSVVTYHLQDEQVLRERPVDDSTTHREVYHLPANAAVSITELEPPTRWELSITRDLNLVGVAPRTLLHTVAEVGRFLRLAGHQEAKP